MPEPFRRLVDCPKPVLCEKRDCADSGRPAGYARKGPRGYGPIRLKKRIAEGGLKTLRVNISEDVNGKVNRLGPQIAAHVMAFSCSHILFSELFLSIMSARFGNAVMPPSRR